MYECTEWMIGCSFAHKLFFFVLLFLCSSLGNRVLIIFWIFPTSSFLLLTSLAALSNKFKFLQPILDASPLIQSLLQNVLPIVFVTIFLAFAPLIILGKWGEKKKSNAARCNAIGCGSEVVS